MILTAFTGDSVQRAVIEGFRDGIKIGAELQKLVEETAERIPARVSSNWLNWIIARMFVVLPTQYLLQMNTCVNEKSWLMSMIYSHHFFLRQYVQFPVYLVEMFLPATSCKRRR